MVPLAYLPRQPAEIPENVIWTSTLAWWILGSEQEFTAPQKENISVEIAQKYDQKADYVTGPNISNFLQSSVEIDDKNTIEWEEWISYT